MTTMGNCMRISCCIPTGLGWRSLDTTGWSWAEGTSTGLCSPGPIHWWPTTRRQLWVASVLNPEEGAVLHPHWDTLLYHHAPWAIVVLGLFFHQMQVFCFKGKLKNENYASRDLWAKLPLGSALRGFRAEISLHRYASSAFHPLWTHRLTEHPPYSPVYCSYIWTLFRTGDETWLCQKNPRRETAWATIYIGACAHVETHIHTSFPSRYWIMQQWQWTSCSWSLEKSELCIVFSCPAEEKGNRMCSCSLWWSPSPWPHPGPCKRNVHTPQTIIWNCKAGPCLIMPWPEVLLPAWSVWHHPRAVSETRAASREDITFSFLCFHQPFPIISGNLLWILNMSLLLSLTSSGKLVSALTVSGDEMMLSNNMNILTLSRAHIRLRNETLGFFEFLPLHPSPCLGPLLCIDCTNKNMVCTLSKLLLCHHFLKNSPQEMWKVTKKFKSQGKTWLVVDLHLLPSPGEGQKKAQEG